MKMWERHDDRRPTRHCDARDVKRILAVKKLIASAVVTICFGTISISAHVRCGDQAVIGGARGAYYNLTKQGFYGFEAALVPKWEVILGPTASKENLKVFRAVRFSMAVDARGEVIITHAVVSNDRTRLQPYIKQIDYNFQRLVKGVLGTWAMFMVNSPFPEESEIKVEDLGKECRLFYNMESTNVMLTMTSDLLLTEWRLTDSRAKRTIKPIFQKTTDGFLLRGYQSVFEPLAAGNKSTLEINIEYQVVSGMKLPRKIQFKGIHGSEPIEAELTVQSVRATPKS
jgi:hypothetical protein